MAERILQDPHLEVRPDHAGTHYQVLRDNLVQHGMTEPEAIQALEDAWMRTHDERIARWDQQVMEDANAAEEAQRQRREEEGSQKSEPCC